MIEQIGISTFRLDNNSGKIMVLTWDTKHTNWVMCISGTKSRTKSFYTLQQVEKKYPDWWGISMLASNAVGVMQ